MKICILAAGAAGMYCGSCLRDNHLAAALMRAGHEVTLVPLYTPLRVDSQDVSIGKVFYGGVNTYLQYASGVFRHTPRMLDWFLDRPWLLTWAGQYGAQTPPGKLGPFVLSVLQGEEGPQIKELRRLVRFLKDDVRPQVVTLPNAMFLGMARMLKEELRVPVICELTGEDIFLDVMAEPYKAEAHEIIRQRAAEVDRFVATSHYYAKKMADYLAVPIGKIDVVHAAIPKEHVVDPAAARADAGTMTIGYFARVCPEKGLDRLVDALAPLRKMPGMSQVRVRAAGYLGPAHRAWFDELMRKVDGNGLSEAVHYVGEVDLAGELRFLDAIDVLCVPAVHPEPKGMYVIESLGRGRPVVLPDVGAFPELVQMTGGGSLVTTPGAEALAEGLAAMLADHARREEAGRRGCQAVRDGFTTEHMAGKMLKVFEAAIGGSDSRDQGSGMRQGAATEVRR